MRKSALCIFLVLMVSSVVAAEPSERTRSFEASVAIDAPDSVTVNEGETKKVDVGIDMTSGAANIHGFTFCSWNFYSSSVKMSSLSFDESTTWQIPIRFKSDSTDNLTKKGTCKVYVIGASKPSVSAVKEISVTGRQNQICEPGATKAETRGSSELVYRCQKGLKWEVEEVRENGNQQDGGGLLGFLG